ACAVRSAKSTAPLRVAHRHAAATGRVRTPTRPVPAAPAGSPLSAVDLLEQINVEIALSEQLLKLGVLDFQGFEALHVCRVQTGKVLAPDVDRLFADLVLLGRLRHRGAIGFTQD